LRASVSLSDSEVKPAFPISRFRRDGPGHGLLMTQAPAPQQREVERAKSRMSTAGALMAASVFAVIVIAIVLYLVLR
jgi:hypothetical protein